MKKGKKRSAAESFSVSDEEAKMRFSHHTLLREYEDLLKKTEARRMRLQQANQKKLRLLAEVKFLRRKHKSLTTNQLGNSSSLLSNTPRSIPSHLFSMNQPSNPSFRLSTKEQIFLPSKDQSSAFQNAAIQNNSGIDLNKVSLPIGEYLDEHQADLEPAKAYRSRKMDPEPVANDLNLSICRGVDSGPNRVKKRKITWQDPVALRV